MSRIQFELLLPYLNKNYYKGRFIRWIIADKKGNDVSCAFCGNMANGVGHKQIGLLHFTLPICKKHCSILKPETQSAPFYIEL